MTGDSHNHDDAEFLDEDFVVEDLAGANDDLEELFDDPNAAERRRAAADAADANAEPGEDDLLFEDHTEGLDDEVQFVKATFDEDGDSDWDGERLDLEAVGQAAQQADAEQQTDAEAQADAEAQTEDVDEHEFAEAEQSFTAELESMLESDEEFAVESIDVDESFDVADNDGVAEYEQSGPFVLDDGEGVWSDELEPVVQESADMSADDGDDVVQLDADMLDGESFDEHSFDEELESFELETDEQPVAEQGENEAFTQPTHTFGDEDRRTTAAPAAGAGQFAIEHEPHSEAGVEPVGGESSYDAVTELYDDGSDATNEELDEVELLESTGADDEDIEGDWEALPEQGIDDLSEVDEVQESYEDYEDEDYEPAYANVEGHDIYEDDYEEAAEVVGGAAARGRAGLWLSLAASFLIVSGAAAIVARPEWFGLRIVPERLNRVEAPRPRITIEVGEPPNPFAPKADSQLAGGELPDGATGQGPQTGEQPTGTQPTGTQPTGTQPPDVHPAGQQPVAGTQPGTGTTPNTGTEPGTGEAPLAGGPETPVDGGANPDQQGTRPDTQVVAGGPELINGPQDWPIAVAEPTRVAPTAQLQVEPTDPAPAEVDAIDDEREELERFGDGLLAGALRDEERGRRSAIDGVLPGTRAFAQLYNGNYFIGQVKSVSAASVTLRVDTGEVTLERHELAQLTQLGSQDFEQLQRVTKGFVRLTNNNRLVGGILSKIADDHVVLEFRKNRVMLPKSAIGEIVSGESEERTVRLDTTDEEESWVRELARRELGTGRGADPTRPEAEEPPAVSPPR